MHTNPDISFVVPVYNEQDNVAQLFEEILAAMAGQSRSWEVVFVDDGSTDRSLDVLRSLAERHAEARYISFMENKGQSAAFCAGFDEALAPVVVTMDADLQNDPADVPAMLDLYDRGGCDMVIGWRRKRRDTWAKRYASRFANALRNSLTHETVRDTGCSLKVMRTDMVRRLPRFKGMHRFLPTLMKMQGAVVDEVPVNHRERQRGVSKYGNWERAVQGAYDLFGVRWLQSRAFVYRIREKNE